MKNNIFFSFCFCLLFLMPAQAQDQFFLTGGTGTPEMINIGLRMRVDQNQYGLNVGTNVAYKHQNFSLSGDYYYHFGGRSTHTSLQPWFIKSGLTYLHSEGEWEKRTNLLLVPRLGREFNINDRFGIALELGIMLMLINEDQPKKERTDEVTGDLDLIDPDFLSPSAGVKIYYSI